MVGFRVVHYASPSRSFRGVSLNVFNRSGWLLFLPAILICSTFASATRPVTSQLPLVFESNQGQAPAGVQYILRGGALQGEFQKDGVRLSLAGGKEIASQVSMRLVGARENVGISGEGTPEGQTNYLVGNDPTHWLRGIPNHSELRYRQIYSGTDLLFYGNGTSLEHDFELQPGADPGRIAFRLEGAQSVTLENNGDLKIRLAEGTITFGRPIAYQTVAGQQRRVEAAFKLDRDRTVRFQLGKYDTAEKLVIDPVLSFSTYLTPLASAANLIATDASGDSYVSGSATLGFPVTSGAFAGCITCTANTPVTFVSKLSADGTRLIYSTVLGGNSFAQPTGIAVDQNGNALVSGWTQASDFPTRNGQPIAPPNNAYLGFLISLSSDGSSLNFGTMLGSPPSVSPAATTFATAVAVDSSGDAYVTGETWDGFFTTTGALNQAVTGNSRNSSDVFLVKFDPAGGLIYSAVLGTADPQNGGGGPIGASAITVDAAGDAFVAGQAGTLWPVTGNAYRTQIGGTMPYASPFVTKVAPDAKSVLYSTYLDDAYVVTGIAALSNGDVFVAGDRPAANYPTTPNAYEQSSDGGGAFLTELSSDGSSLLYATLFGDPSYQLHGMALDPDGDIWLAGQTSSSGFALVNPIQPAFPSTIGYSDSVSTLSQFDPTGQTLKFSTFLGGSTFGLASSVALDSNHRAHVSGAAGPGMYTTPGAYVGSVPVPSPVLSGATYAYVALIDPATSTGTVCFGGSASAGLTFGYLLPQTTASQSVQVTNCGSAPLTFTSVYTTNPAFTLLPAGNGCTGSLAVGSSCTISVQFAPTAVQDYAGQLTITSNATIAASSIALSGGGGEPAAGFGPPGGTESLIFSPLLVGQKSAAQFIQLYNNGQVPLTISKIAVSGGFALAQGGNCLNSVAANQFCSIAVLFTPTAPGTINGTLSVSSSDPANPTISTTLTGTAFAAYPIATITALLNPSYPVSSGTTPLSMSVFGNNFFPESVVYINGVAQTTTYQSANFLAVTFSPSLLSQAGSLPVTVVNPTPGGGSSAPYPLIVYLAVPMTASALTVDPVGGLLYAAIPASAAQNPNTVIPIDPATGTTMTPVPVASGPRALAVSDDGSELYVASTGVLQRFNVKTLALEKTFNLPVDPQLGQTYVQEMHVVPGSPKSIVVELFANVDPAEDGAALYDDSGLINWLPGTSAHNNPLTIDSFTFTSPSTIYALPQASSFFAQVQVSPTGLSHSGGGGEINEQTGSIVRSDGNLLYTNSGQVWDPSTQNLLGTYLEPSGSQLFYAAGVVPDKPNGHTYFLDGNSSYSEFQALTIDVYDQASYSLLGVVPFTDIYSYNATDLVRWGSNGFAFRSVDITGSQPAANAIVIVTSDLIKSNSSTPTPILASVSPATVDAAGPSYSMQVTGSGFTSASTVLVNGTSRATTYVSGTALTAQVLAADIAATGQLEVQVSTPAPGGGISNYAIVSIQPPTQTAPTVTLTQSATSVTTAQALTVTVSVTGVAGNATPTGSVVLTGGGFTSAPVPLTSGAATIAIPAGSLTVGTDTLTVAYTPDSIGSSAYSSAMGTTSVMVTAPPDFALSASLASLSIPQNGVVTSTIAVSATNGFSGSVALAASGLPNGVTASFAPGTGAGTQVLTLTAAATATMGGPVTVLVTGTSGSLTSSTSIALTITAASSFQASESTQAITIDAGATTGNTSTISLTGTNGFSGLVSLNCSVNPSSSGVPPACSLSPASVTLSGDAVQTTTLTVTTTAPSSAENDLKKLLMPSAGGTSLALLLMVVLPRRTRKVRLILGLLLFASFNLIGCSGGGGGSVASGGNSGTTAGTYTITVTGTGTPTGSPNSVTAVVGTIALTVK
jgi:hypothetical protein